LVEGQAVRTNDAGDESRRRIGSWPRSWWNEPVPRGVGLVGPGGLLTGLTKDVLGASLEAELSEHLGYDRHDPAGRERGSNSRRASKRAKPVAL
jgi:hypothetical protein